MIATWSDIAMGSEVITKDKAIAAVEEGSALGEEIVKLIMTGYGVIYKSFLPHNEMENPLMKVKPCQHSPPSELVIIPESVHFAPTEKIASELQKPAKSEAKTMAQEYSSKQITVKNSLPFKVRVCREFDNPLVDILPGDKVTISTPLNIPLVAQSQTKQKSRSASIVSAYLSYPGNATWNITPFPADSFLPSGWPNLNDKLLAASWEVHITNNLKTYVCIWQVLPNGNLHYVHCMPQDASITADPCYVGTSLVATQGGTVISKFFAGSAAHTKWSIDTFKAPDDDIYKTGNNNYIFYQVHIRQNDMVTPSSKQFDKQITIPPGVKFLYANLFDSSNAYFAAPEGVTVTIDSKDESGTIKHYNEDTNTENLYIQMNGKSLHKLCVKDPVAGEWRIKIQAKTNTPLVFQFQTLPTKDPRDTIRDTFKAGILGFSTAYAGLANFVNAPLSGDGDSGQRPAAIELIYKALFEGRNLLPSSSDLHNHYELSDIEQAIQILLSIAADPAPRNPPKILLVDANGDEQVTKRVYEGRKELLYDKITPGGNYVTKLVGEEEEPATKISFESKLGSIPDLKLVSIAGHGNSTAVYGYLLPGITVSNGELIVPPDVDRPLPILQTPVEPGLVHGKIFHLFSCRSAAVGGLGQALVKNGARAFIGYNEIVGTIKSKPLWMFKPDCAICLTLMEGKTVKEAVTVAKAYYRVLVNKVTRQTEIENEKKYAIFTGILKVNHDALTIEGDCNARLYTDS